MIDCLACCYVLLNMQVQDISAFTLVLFVGLLNMNLKNWDRIFFLNQKVRPVAWMHLPVCFYMSFCHPTCSSIAPVIMSSCQTLPVIVSVFETRRLLLLDLLQLLFLLHSPLFFFKSNNTDIACLLHTCWLFRPVALKALHGLYIYCCDECPLVPVCSLSLYIHHS